MKRTRKVFFVIAFLLSATAVATGQEVIPELAKVAKALECQTPQGWKRERVMPLLESKEVLIEQYYLNGRSVRVSVLYHQSDLAAIKTMQDFTAHERTSKVQDLGDEAYAWGYSESLAMRKGSYTVYLSAASDLDSVLPGYDKAERYKLGRAEAVALTKNFARIVTSTLSDLADACRTPRASRPVLSLS